VAAYIPRKGDFVTVDFDPQSGHMQKDRRPVLVVSNDLFNKATGLCMACPVASTRRDYPFHVSIPEGLDVAGVVMVEQIRPLDFQARGVKHLGPAPERVLDEVLSILDACVY
jgi:mRNA interferase MazF